MEERNYLVQNEDGYRVYREVARAKSLRKLSKTMRRILERDLASGKNAIFTVQDKQKEYEVVLNEEGNFEIVEAGKIIATKTYYRDLYLEIAEITRKNDERGLRTLFEFKEV